MLRAWGDYLRSTLVLIGNASFDWSKNSLCYIGPVLQWNYPNMLRFSLRFAQYLVF
jgi:hypothetical protein